MERAVVEELRERLRRALPAAMRSRDAATVAALRSALAAIDNAEAVEPDAVPQAQATEGGPGGLAGTVAGLGAAEVERHALTEAEMAGIVRAEIAERHSAAATYERAGRHDRAERLLAEAAALECHMDGG